MHAVIEDIRIKQQMCFGHVQKMDERLTEEVMRWKLIGRKNARNQ